MRNSRSPPRASRGWSPSPSSSRTMSMSTRYCSARRHRGCDIMATSLKILVVGATGSIGRLVVAEALRQGHAVCALARGVDRGRRLPDAAEVVIGDVTKPETLTDAVAGIDAIVSTLGSDGGGKAGAEAVDYGGVR